MKYGVIDIGSNSVRLMISVDGTTEYKLIKITKLAKGVDSCFNLSKDSINRTAEAVSFFVLKAKEEKVDKLFLFATAAVRNAKNKDEFLDVVYKNCNERVDVVSGELEAEIGFLGVYPSGDGGLIDIGGASSEIAVVKNGKKVYSKSLNIGAVNTTDKCKNDFEKTDEYLKNAVVEYGEVPRCKFSAVGGTATSVASVLLEQREYDPRLVNGYSVTVEKLGVLTEKVAKMTVEERRNIVGLQPERAENFLSGILILKNIMEHLKVGEITVSESDNLEGYLRYKTERK